MAKNKNRKKEKLAVAALGRIKKAGIAVIAVALIGAYGVDPGSKIQGVLVTTVGVLFVSILVNYLRLQTLKRI